MRWVVAWLVVWAMVPGREAVAQDQGGKAMPLWDFYNSVLKTAKYIDLTHAIAPGGPIGEGFADFKVGPTLAGVAIPGVIGNGEPFTYEKQGVAITAYELPMDHIGTQFGPPAHENDHGATISDTSMSRPRSLSTPATRLPLPI